MATDRIVFSHRDLPDSFVDSWQQTIDLLARLFDVPAGLIMRVHEEEIEVFTRSDTEGNPYTAGKRESLNTGLYCETVMQSKELLHVPDALADEAWRNNPDLNLNMISYLGVPLLEPSGEVFGTMCVLDTKKREYDEGYIELLQSFRRLIEQDFLLITKNAELEESYARINRDLNAAAAAQKALLPKSRVVHEGVELAWTFRPTDALGGDMLNVFPISHQQVGLFVLDVSGHGVPASLLSVTATRSLWPYAGHESTVPDSVVECQNPNLVERVIELNRTLTMESTGGKFLTLLLASVCTTSGTLRFVNAGHPPPVLLRGDKASELKSDGFLLGVDTDADFEEHQLTMQDGDRVYLFTDGVVEQSCPDGNMFGVAKLREVIADSRDCSLQASIDNIVGSVVSWCSNPTLTDDLTILAVELTS